MTSISSSNSRTSHRCSMKRREREEVQHWGIGPSHQCLRTTETQLTIRVKREKLPRRPRRTTIAQLRICKGKCLKIRWSSSTTYRLRISSLKSNLRELLTWMSSITITIALATWTILLTKTSSSTIETRPLWTWTKFRVRCPVIWTSRPWAAVEPVVPGRRPLEGKCRTQATSLGLSLELKVKTLWSPITPLSFWTTCIATCKTCRRAIYNSKWLNKTFLRISETSQTWTLVKAAERSQHQALRATS